VKSEIRGIWQPRNSILYQPWTVMKPSHYTYLSGSLLLTPWWPNIKDSYTDNISLPRQKQQLQQKIIQNLNIFSIKISWQWMQYKYQYNKWFGTIDYKSVFGICWSLRNRYSFFLIILVYDSWCTFLRCYLWLDVNNIQPLTLPSHQLVRPSTFSIQWKDYLDNP
jgi:hypothetical protein